MKYRFLRYPDGKDKAVTFSYDDGCAADIRLLETLTMYSLKGTFNICSGRIGESGLTKEQLKSCILDKGHEIAVHTKGHRAAGHLRAAEAIKDILECRDELENMFDTIIRGLAYADSGIGCFTGGLSYCDVKNYLSELDIAYARTLGKDNDRFLLPEDWYSWMPTAHHDNEHIFEYIEKFLTLDLSKVYCSGRAPRLFYIWGHSYEFDKKNNWERLAEICERLSGHQDIWYATNIEIYNYVSAYNSLVYSIDGTRIYNPTNSHIWFDIDGTLYSISPGETLKII